MRGVPASTGAVQSPYAHGECGQRQCRHQSGGKTEHGNQMDIDNKPARNSEQARPIIGCVATASMCWPIWRTWYSAWSEPQCFTVWLQISSMSPSARGERMMRPVISMAAAKLAFAQ